MAVALGRSGVAVPEAEDLADLGAAVLAVEVRAEVGDGGVHKTEL